MPTQTGSIDFTSAGGLKSYAAGQFATQDTVTNMQTQIDQNAEAITLRATKTEASQMAQPNLIPFFSMDLADIYHSTNNPNGYWFANSAAPTKPNATWNRCWTQLENGWAHIEAVNSGSSTIGYYASGGVAANAFIESGKTYTILTEMRNCTGTPANIYASTGAGDTRFGGGANQVSKFASGSYVHYDVMVARDVTTTTMPSRPFNFRIQVAAGNSFGCDVRVSLYEGEYSGPYKPYSGTQLYASQAELKVQADRIGMVVSNADASSSLQLTPDAITAVTNSLTIKGSSGSATVISGGKIQANSLTIGDMSADTQADILNSNVQVGGRNLLIGSSTGNGWSYSTFDASSVVYTSSTTTTTESFVQVPRMTFDAGETYTLSCWAKSNGNVRHMDLYKVHVSGSGSHQYRVSIPLTNEYQKIVWTFTCNATSDEVAYIRFDNNGSKTSGTEAILYVKEPKLEKGNKATDWTAAPEDVESSIIEASKTASNYITEDSTGIKIHMSGSTSTYQHQSSTATTYYVNGNKRAEVGANGLKVYVGTTGSESSVAEFGTTARVGSASGPNVYVESGGVSVRDGTTGVVKFTGSAESGYYTRSSSVELAGWNGTALRMRGDLSTDNRYIGLESGFGSLLDIRHTDSVTEYGSFEGNDFVELEADGLSVNGTTVDIDKQVLQAFLTQSGMVAQSISASANAVTSHTVTFPIPYEVSPIVTACFYSTSTSAAFGGLSLSVSAITTTSFTVKIFNNTGTGRTVGIFWTAAPQTTLT